MLQEEQNLVSKGGQLARGNLGGEIVGNLVLLAVRGPRIARAAEKEEDRLTTFPRSVMAAKRVASGSALDWRIPITVPQESFYKRDYG